jgi:hypothetical protein
LLSAVFSACRLSWYETTKALPTIEASVKAPPITAACICGWSDVHQTPNVAGSKPTSPQ